MQSYSTTTTYLLTFLKYTLLAGYEIRLNETLQLEAAKKRNNILANVGNYFFKKQNHEKARFYWNQIEDEAMKEELLSLLK